MGQTAEELRRDIESTRGNLGVTMDAIEQKVSPRAIAERRKSAMAERWTSVRESVMGRVDDLSSSAGTAVDTLQGTPTAAGQAATQQAQGNPFAAGLIAFGAGLLAAALLPVSEAEQEAAGTLVEKAQPLAEEAKEIATQIASDVKDEGAQHVQDLREETSSAATHVADTARSATAETREAGTAAVQDVRDQGSGAPPPPPTIPPATTY